MKTFVINILKENLKLVAIFIVMMLISMFSLLALFFKETDLLLGWFTIPLFALVTLLILPVIYIVISYRIILASGIFAMYETSKDTISIKIGDHINNRVTALGLSDAAFVKDGLDMKETVFLLIDELIEILPDGIENHVKKMFSKMPMDKLIDNVGTTTALGITGNLNLGDKVFNAIDNKVQFFLKPSFKWNYLLFLANISLGTIIFFF